MSEKKIPVFIPDLVRIRYKSHPQIKMLIQYWMGYRYWNCHH
jgi:hypothetical protein